MSQLQGIPLVDYLATAKSFEAPVFDATTIPASSLEKFKAPTPKTGETSFTASITSGDKVASGVSVSFETEGFTDAYTKYKVTVDGQVIKGLTVAELKEGVGPFAIGPNQTARVTLEYDNPAYALKGFGKDTTIKSVTVTAEKLSTPAVTVAPSTVEAGKTVTVKGTGFAPESTVTITLHSEPVEVGTATTDENGDFTADVTVPADTEAGDHTVVAESTTPVATASAPLTVTAPPAPAEDPSAAPSEQPSAAPAPEQGGKGGLARTGTNALILVAAALVAAGAGTAFIRRSRLAKS